MYLHNHGTPPRRARTSRHDLTVDLALGLRSTSPETLARLASYGRERAIGRCAGMPCIARKTIGFPIVLVSCGRISFLRRAAVNIVNVR